MHDARLAPETLLQLAPGVRARFDAAGHVLVDAPDGTIIDVGPRGFAVLALFARPLALGDAVERLEADERSPTDFLPTMSVIKMLMEEGALVRPHADRDPTRGWSDPVEHARMLHDDRRTGDYLAALGEAVRPGDVVPDVGTGSGVLAIAAARAGARHVYAVEATDIRGAHLRLLGRELSHLPPADRPRPPAPPPPTPRRVKPDPSHTNKVLLRPGSPPRRR